MSVGKLADSACVEKLGYEAQREEGVGRESVNVRERVSGETHEQHQAGVGHSLHYAGDVVDLPLFLVVWEEHGGVARRYVSVLEGQEHAAKRPPDGKHPVAYT